MTYAKISDVHGQAMQVKGRLIVPMYHPAAALHQRSLRPVIEKDFSRLPGLIAKAGNIPEMSVESKAEQASAQTAEPFLTDRSAGGTAWLFFQLTAYPLTATKWPEIYVAHGFTEKNYNPFTDQPDVKLISQ